MTAAEDRDACARANGRRKAVLASWYATMEMDPERAARLALPPLASDVLEATYPALRQQGRPTTASPAATSRTSPPS